MVVCLCLPPGPLSLPSWQYKHLTWLSHTSVVVLNDQLSTTVEPLAVAPPSTSKLSPTGLKACTHRGEPGMSGSRFHPFADVAGVAVSRTKSRFPRPTFSPFLSVNV